MFCINFQLSRVPVCIVALAGFSIAMSESAVGVGPGSFTLPWSTIDGGGGASNGGGFSIRGSIGQPDAGAMSGGTFALTGGFWPGNGPPDPAPLCPADISPSGMPNGIVNVDDLLAIINAWGACANPNNCPADIAPAGGNDIVNVDDLLAVINAWGACP